ncbi:hypothetical protein [Chromobacterium sphagni]|uniref:hypothetical protein n=1 Tax=Chromobacterium sphagni TaxID=1903179 RepID=UPI0008DADF2E|nr:hypothetical protein [Chromobacterium sphagni]
MAEHSSREAMRMPKIEMKEYGVLRKKNRCALVLLLLILAAGLVMSVFFGVSVHGTRIGLFSLRLQ